jgi:RAT1-interacting protein
LPHSWHECTREQIEKRNEHVVDNYAQYCSVAKTAIGGVELILGGEVDASKCHIASGGNLC